MSNSEKIQDETIQVPQVPSTPTPQYPNIPVPGVPPINIQIGEIKKETIYSKKWIEENIKKRPELVNFILSLFIQHDVVKGLFIPTQDDSSIASATKKETREKDDNLLKKIKEQYKNFFKFSYNIVKNDDKTIGVSVVKPLKKKDKQKYRTPTKDDYLGAKCASSSQKKSITHTQPRKWKIQLICKFSDTKNTREILKKISSDILINDYTLLLSEELCHDNNGPCSITKEPSNEILQYYNGIIRNTELLLKNIELVGDFFPTLIDSIQLVVEGVPSVADIAVKLQSPSSTFNKCEEIELDNMLDKIKMDPTNLDTPENKAKVIILLSLYDDTTVDDAVIDTIRGLIQKLTPADNPPPNRDLNYFINHYVEQLLSNTTISGDAKLKTAVENILIRLDEYRTNSSCQATFNKGVSEVNNSVSELNKGLSDNAKKMNEAIGKGIETMNETIKDRSPEVVKDSIENVEQIISPTVNYDDNDNFVKAILMLVNNTSREVSVTKTKENISSIDIEEDTTKETTNEKEEPISQNTDPLIGEKEEPFGELVIGEKEEPFGELVIGEKEEPFGELAIGEKEEPFGELAIGEKEEPFGDLVIGEKEEPFGELVIGQNNIENETI